ncbi:hypothetical protein HG263_10825 [Pseudoalteromonas sp. JBTF-M23]|uniref:Uncharacterized protein n=1 Tax=Pseudoalteromonas caenipelagi TaxID=2726988 RepID=A0A849VCK3_9GAMM|nr:hypothetical protein [Pseudoalteromonas caenipelagi]NOU51026.1 hypothetical protein [Pseudoalteromonas caenipelagi]
MNILAKVCLLGVIAFYSSHSLAKNKTVYLSNEDFKYGTYLINEPGTYVLSEDITFNPNSIEALSDYATKHPNQARILNLNLPISAYQSGFPLFTQYKHGKANNNKFKPFNSKYDPAAYGLGFFAAIAVSADNVTIDLNGKVLQQSEEHALLQRFFALIELADQPFIPKQGPADFGTTFDPAKNVVIKNGTLGLSAHHGIHGNGNVNVKIENVNFEDFEVAAVALNGVDGLEINNSYANNRKDIPIIGLFSAAQFIKHYINYLERVGSPTVLEVNGAQLDVHDIKSSLETSINNVYADVIYGNGQINNTLHADEYAIFHNKSGLLDGNSYSYLLNHMGVAVNGFPLLPYTPQKFPARNVTFRNVVVKAQHADIVEVIAIDNNGTAVIDPNGAVFQLFNRHPETGQLMTISDESLANARYLGNVVSNAQAFVAKAKLNGEFENAPLDVSRLNISRSLLDWVEGKRGSEYLTSVVPSADSLFCNGDSMFHVNKGAIGFKLDGAQDVTLINTKIEQIKNFSQPGSTMCGDPKTVKSHPLATLSGYGGTASRGYSVSGSVSVEMRGVEVGEVYSAHGHVNGVDVLTNSHTVLLSSVVLNWLENLSGAYHPAGIEVGSGVELVDIQGACLQSSPDNTLVDHSQLIFEFVHNCSN